MKREGNLAARRELHRPEAAVEKRIASTGRRLRLQRGLIRPAGRRIDLTNEEIYSLIEFP